MHRKINQEWFKTKREVREYLTSRGWREVSSAMGVTKFVSDALVREAFATRWGRRWHLSR